MRDMKYGYARVSTDDQNPALQLAALKKAGCETIFRDDGISGATTKRPALLRYLRKLQAGDTLAVWRLDRLGRSLRDLITMLDDLKHRGVKFQSVTEAIDTVLVQTTDRESTETVVAPAAWISGSCRQHTGPLLGIAPRHTSKPRHIKLAFPNLLR
jgi:hypothetical protein